MTNLLFMGLGIKGVISCRRNQHDQIFLVAYLGYLVVGTGSFLFHATLKCMSLRPGALSRPCPLFRLYLLAMKFMHLRI